MGKLHHLNVGCSDANIIITSSATFLVDCHNISDYASHLPSSKHLRGVFITHQHTDHFSGLNYLRDNKYTIDWLIHSPYERKSGDSSVSLDEWNNFNSLKDYFVSKGTKTAAPFRQASFEKPYWDTNGARFWILAPDRTVVSKSSMGLHDACLVITAQLGNRKCVFAGDASDANLEHVAQNTNNICDDILNASHHGSLNGAELTFIKKCNPKYTIISTKAGVYESVPHATALARYKSYTREKVYRTDIDGTITFTF